MTESHHFTRAKKKTSDWDDFLGIGLRVVRAPDDREKLLGAVADRPKFNYSSLSSSSETEDNKKELSKKSAEIFRITSVEDEASSNGDEKENDIEEFIVEYVDSEGKPPENDSIPSLVQDMFNSVSGRQSNVEALRLYRSGQHDRAMHEWKYAAKYHKLPAAAFNLGVCFIERENIRKAFKYYKMAADSQHVKAIYDLGVLIWNNLPYFKGQHDENDAVGFLKKAADLGLKQAQTAYGRLLMEKKEENLMTAAVEYFSRASEQQCHEATYFLGICHENGFGVERDLAKAFELYGMASRGQHPEAQHNLAVFFERGYGGIQKDRKEALRWYKEAVKNGLEQSSENVRRMEELVKCEDDVSTIAEYSTDQLQDYGNLKNPIMPSSSISVCGDLSSMETE